MKLCKDCLYCDKGNLGADYYKCLSKSIPSVPSPVSGEMKPRWVYCEYNRTDKDSCGPEGKFWEPLTIYEAAMRQVK